jgi:exportin-7
MDDQQLAQLELVCQQFYESMDLVVRSEAEKALVTFSESPESLPQCQFILERSQSPFALLLAASTLTKLVTRSTANLSVQDRLQLRSYVLQYLGSNLYLAPYVTQALVQLIARITKDGWFNGDKKGFVFRDILDEVGKFLRVRIMNPWHCTIMRTPSLVNWIRVLQNLFSLEQFPTTCNGISNLPRCRGQ